MKLLLKWVMPFLLVLSGVPIASAGFLQDYEKQLPAGFDEGYEAKNWQEIETRLPEAPKPENWLPFYVSAATDNKFYVDPPSVSVGKDGVVRYTLIVMSSSGSRNVSFEGMRCSSREKRVYAFGRTDGVWSKSRNNQWEVIRDLDVNRQHAALFLDFFCPGGVIAPNTAEVIRTMREAARK